MNLRLTKLGIGGDQPGIGGSAQAGAGQRIIRPKAGAKPGPVAPPAEREAPLLRLRVAAPGTQATGEMPRYSVGAVFGHLAPQKFSYIQTASFIAFSACVVSVSKRASSFDEIPAPSAIASIRGRTSCHSPSTTDN